MSCVVLALVACTGEPDDAGKAPTSAKARSTANKIPITSESTEAVELYYQAADLYDKLRFPEAFDTYAAAVEKDPGFALALFGMANTATSFQEFFELLERAAQASESASEAERWMIQGQLFGTNGNPSAQLEYYTYLVEKYPEDEHAHDLIGNLYFTNQDYQRSIEHCKKATEINPGFSSPYNNLGYAYKAVGNYAAADEAFRKYIELIPDEPNPYDSYAELLMKMGRFEESIATYRKALERDPEFHSSYIGIGHNQIFLGRTEEARKTFREVYQRSDAFDTRREALLWTATSYLVDGNFEAALAKLWEHHAIAEKAGDAMEISGDLRLIASVHLVEGHIDEAESLWQRQLKVAEEADISDYLKDSLRRNQLYREARIAVARGDLELARRKAKEYRQKVAVMLDPFEIRRQHEIEGEIALAAGMDELAAANLAKADQSNPRILYLEALVSKAQGKIDEAKELAAQVIGFNEPSFNYALYKRRAEEI